MDVLLRGTGLRIEVAHQGAIFQHPVVIDPHRDEHEIALPRGVERRDHVAEEAEPGRAQMPVAGKAALGVERLHDTAGCRHLHVARQHAAVERIIGVPTHEEPAERFNQGLQGPGPRPFAHRIAQGGAIRGHVGDADVIRIAAVIHHKHDARVGLDAGQRCVVGIAEADAIEHLQQAPGEGIAKAEIDVDVERRDNLPRIALDLAQSGLRAAARTAAPRSRPPPSPRGRASGDRLAPVVLSVGKAGFGGAGGY